MGDGADAVQLGATTTAAPVEDDHQSTWVTADVQMANSTLQSSSQCKARGSVLGSTTPTTRQRESCCGGCFAKWSRPSHLSEYGLQYVCDMGYPERDPDLIYQGFICCSDDCPMLHPMLHGDGTDAVQLDGADAVQLGATTTAAPVEDDHQSTWVTADVQMANSTLQSSSQCKARGSVLGSTTPTTRQRESCC